MRKFLLYTFFSLFLTLNVFAQTWTRMQSWGLDFESINWATADLGFIVGERLIIRTTNGGLSWEEVPISFEGKLKDVDFFDDRNGVAVGENGLIFYSQNAGESWTKAVSTTTLTLNSVSFFSEEKLFAIGESGTILHSLDGGKTWTRKTAGTNETLNDIHFSSLDTAFIAGNNGKILRTSDGGSTWISLNSGQSVHLNGVVFSSSEIGYVAGNNGTILKTNDSGTNWVVLVSPVSTDLNKITVSPIDVRIIAITGESSTALRTINSGKDFSKINLGSTTPGSLFNLAFKPSSAQLFAVGLNGNLISSTNSGTSFSLRLLGIRNDLTAVDFKTDRFGIIAGEQGELFVTSNGGVSLIKRPLPEQIKIVSIDFWSTSFGYVSGESGKMYRTGNTGTSWVATPAQTSETINGFYLFAPSVAYIAGSNGYIGRSFDSGLSWDGTIQSSTSADLKDITFFDFQVGFAMGDNGQISWSNGGNIWENLPKLTTENLNALTKVDSSTAIIVGDNGVILKSEDKARTWRRIEISETENLNSVDFWDSSIGFIVGDNGKTLITNDGGETWGTIPSGTIRNLTSVSAGNPTIAYAVGDDGTIVKYICVAPTDLSKVIGPIASCLTTQKYSITDELELGSSIVWRVEGGQIKSGQGTKEIEVEWTDSGNNGVFVSRRNFCGSGETSFIAVVVSQTPESTFEISGEGKVCADQENTYSIPELSGVSYTWSVTGGELVSGQGESSITVNWISSGIQQIGLILENSCGQSDQILKQINVSDPPAKPDKIQGNSNVGLGLQTYEIPNQLEVNFRWEISAGGRIQQGQGTNRIVVDWQDEGVQTLTVTPQNECNDGPSQTLSVTVNIITSLPEELEIGVKIYPNPSEGRVYVELKDATIWESIQLINSIGQLIHHVELSGSQQRIQFENLAQGIFIIQLQNRNDLKQYKLIVKQ